MTTYHILQVGPATGTDQVSSKGTGIQFKAFVGTKNSLIVDDSAFLKSTGDVAVYLGPATSAWSVTIAGIVSSDVDNAVWLAGTSNVTNGPQSKITITDSGTLFNSNTGYQFETLFLQQATALINNGSIANATGSAINFDSAGKSSLINTGTITAASGYNSVVSLENGDVALTNSGTIKGKVQLSNGNNTISNTFYIYGSLNTGSGNDKLTNGIKGTISGVTLGDGVNVASNAGIITAGSGAITGGSGTNTVTNNKTGYLGGGVSFGDGHNSFSNDGIVEDILGANISYAGGALDDTIKNTNTMSGSIHVFDGTNSLTNSGTVGYDSNHVSYLGGIGTDKVTNSGILQGNVILGGGNDTFTNTGHVSGDVYLGDGDDHYNGGAFYALVHDESGADVYKFGSAGDVFFAYYTPGAVPDGLDVVDGGNGENVYSAISAPGFVEINLDKVSHTGIHYAGIQTAKSTARVDPAHSNVDTVLNFQDATLGTGGGIAFGTSGANLLTANGGTSELMGFAGNDTLVSGSGTNYLVGGAGADTLNGTNLQSYTYFVYTAISDSGITAATRDVINNFAHGTNFIDLSAIDANSTTPAFNDTFSSALIFDDVFTKQPGELRAMTTATGERIEGDVNGDGKADFSIDLADSTHSIHLQATDFIL